MDTNQLKTESDRLVSEFRSKLGELEGVRKAGVEARENLAAAEKAIAEELKKFGVVRLVFGDIIASRRWWMVAAGVLLVAVVTLAILLVSSGGVAPKAEMPIGITLPVTPVASTPAPAVNTTPVEKKAEPAKAATLKPVKIESKPAEVKAPVEPYKFELAPGMTRVAEEK